MTNEEFVTHWLPAIKLLSRAGVYLDDFKNDENYPPHKLCAKLSKDINELLNIVPKVSG